MNRFKGGGEKKSDKSRDETKGDPFSAKTNWKASAMKDFQRRYRIEDKDY